MIQIEAKQCQPTLERIPASWKHFSIMEKCAVTYYRMRVILWKNTPVVAAALSSLDVVADAAGPSGVHPVFRQ